MKKIIRNILILFFILFVSFVVFLFTTEKGHELRRFAAETILSTQHRQWAKWTFLSQKELDEILHKIQNPSYSNTIVAPSVDSKEITNQHIKEGHMSIPTAKAPLTVNVKTIEKKDSPTSYYEGKLMTISNPHNVKLRSSSLDYQGEQIFTIADRVNAIAATNASGFQDTNGRGNGGTSLGIIIEDGQIKNSSNGQSNFAAGLTNNGQLLTGKFTANELVNLHVKYAAGFKPQLISNGKKMITDGDGGWGAGPRTAIGQTRDGKILLLVIDGRQPHSIGATIREVQDILYDHGAINALAMDGGSSSSMYLNGENITTPSSVGHIPRYLPNIWAVIPKKGQKVKVVYDGKILLSKKKY